MPDQMLYRVIHFYGRTFSQAGFFKDREEADAAIDRMQGEPVETRDYMVTYFIGYRDQNGRWREMSSRTR